MNEEKLTCKKLTCDEIEKLLQQLERLGHIVGRKTSNTGHAMDNFYYKLHVLTRTKKIDELISIYGRLAFVYKEGNEKDIGYILYHLDDLHLADREILERCLLAFVRGYLSEVKK